MPRATPTPPHACAVTSAPRMTTAAPARGRGRPNPTQASGLRERAWWLIRTLGRPFTLDDLLFTINDGSAADAENNLGRYLRQLATAGVVQRLARKAPGRAPTSNGLVVWRLARDLGPKAPVYRSAAHTVWDPNSQALLQPEAGTTAPSTNEPATHE